MGDGGSGDRRSHHSGHWGESKQSRKNSESIRQKKDSCLAHIVYNGSDVFEVNVLRRYRDKVLMQDELGRRFVEWYYDGAGEKIAEFVKDRGKFLIPVIKKGLDYIVKDYLERER